MSTDRPIAVVTGGAGFLGSHMVDLLLDRGFAVRVMDDLSGGREANLADHVNEPRLAVEWRDIRRVEPEDSLFAGVEIVFHFAGIGDIVPSIEQPTAYMEVNVQGTVRVLEAARAAGVRKLIYAASSSCYGIADVPTREDHPIAPQYPYALSKYLGEQAAFHWHQVYGLQVNSIRIFNAYGTRSRTSGAYGAVFGVFLKQKLEGKPLTVIGDGTQRRDFVHASDVAEGFLLAAETPRTGQVWNLGTDDPQTVNRLVELLDSEIVYLPKRPGEPDCTWVDTTKIRTELGWRPRISFQEGVGRMLEHIDYWRDAPLWDAESIADSTRAWFTFLSSERKSA